MTLSRLLENVPVIKMFQTYFGQHAVTQDLHINHIQYDSRKVVKGDLFIAITGSETDGHKYIDQAVANGAIVVVLENDTVISDSFFMHAKVVKIVVKNSRTALAQISSNYFDRPSKKMSIVGVTGTNGKTTTTHLIKSILEYCGIKTGLLGTIEYQIGDVVLPASHTTPESLELNDMFDKMVKSGCKSAVMEVSSHALHQHRVEGIDFKAAVFTNLTQDHLDYHHSMEEYFYAKNILFMNLSPDSFAIVNADDEWSNKIIQATKAKKILYGTFSQTDVYAKNISLSMKGIKFTIVYNGEETVIESQLIGRFNVSNVLAAFTTGIALGISNEKLRDAIRSTKTVRGRFEQIESPKGWTAVIDYAHTPDALEKALKTVHDVFDSSKKGKIITVFGCGGNRDRTKRPKMGTIASTLSDVTIVTSDNPRHEDQEAIIDEVMKGIKSGSVVYREADRKKAVFKALELGNDNDVILIAGKGHEDYQVIGSQKVHFSDHETVEEFISIHA